MTRREKQFARLDALEASFRTQLIEALESCASGHYTKLFVAGEFMPDDWPPAARSAVTDQLFESADGIVKTRSELGLAADRCLAYRFRVECRDHMELNDAHRLGPIRRAQGMLSEIRGSV